MQIFCYIIYSESIDRYYIGYTTDINERLKLHNAGHFGGKSYTSKATDWLIFLLIPCESVEQAIFVEARIKKMKSRKYIEDLIKYPEMINRLRNDFNK
ncbi:MAG: GIY-YIG nuclease family protein [Bacteroidales bacterium]|nr:GIY-YIG nuclease family protein [Bacteroidales bacterium]